MTPHCNDAHIHGSPADIAHPVDNNLGSMHGSQSAATKLSRAAEAAHPVHCTFHATIACGVSQLHTCVSITHAWMLHMHAPMLTNWPQQGSQQTAATPQAGHCSDVAAYLIEPWQLWHSPLQLLDMTHNHRQLFRKPLQQPRHVVRHSFPCQPMPDQLDAGAGCSHSRWQHSPACS